MFAVALPGKYLFVPFLLVNFGVGVVTAQRIVLFGKKNFMDTLCF